MKPDQPKPAKTYYFIDIDAYSRQIVSCDSDTKAQLTAKLTNGCVRIYLSKGQFNKLTKELTDARR